MGNELNYHELIDRLSDNDGQDLDEVDVGGAAPPTDARRVIERMWEEQRLQRELRALDLDVDDLDDD
ncbi:hypothetical protein ACN2MM_04060 [Alkalilimnicola ehrlichii MLHE-1]|uniref:Uncharacterized protein n=1 Tax=Alkalilimnicola ehrlichii (strain ATCC BAA-1101 / DSM 17681 / MLHE-1) TaxID=187272 RepID=Q0AAU1_ALKEH|nr:hypothetical protein [Alkalilimnicola ehrlichii]ABI56046.1 hypothetical protein Mlg_0692 [Alkalilimnicola ehrlichii MLHE-1]